MPSVCIAGDYFCRNFSIHQKLRPTRIREIIMAKVFRITPKAIHRTNGTVLTPEMDIIVTLDHSTSDPFYNGAKEIHEMYMDKYGFDYKRANATKAWFDIERLD